MEPCVLISKEEALNSFALAADNPIYYTVNGSVLLGPDSCVQQNYNGCFTPHAVYDAFLQKKFGRNTYVFKITAHILPSQTGYSQGEFYIYCYQLSGENCSEGTYLAFTNSNQNPKNYVNGQVINFASRHPQAINYMNELSRLYNASSYDYTLSSNSTHPTTTLSGVNVWRDF